MMDYIPSPMDVTNIELSEDLLPIVELLSKNVHEVWSLTRMGQGWRYGAHRDDARKLHPDIIPYEELTEEEKAHDRNSVVATLKALIAMGYLIEKSERE